MEVMGRFDPGVAGWLPMTEAFDQVEHHAIDPVFDGCAGHVHLIRLR
jgi:hypothetical protein